MRIEHDTMGSVSIPKYAYYGPQTQRAIDHCPISGRTIPPELIRAIGYIKWGAAKANLKLGLLTENCRVPLSELEVESLISACEEVANGQWDSEFPIDVFQTGSGTSSNMNANEVIANRANELAGHDRFADEKPIHPNDHVNLGQSTNDTFPSAIHIAVAYETQYNLIPALLGAATALRKKAEEWSSILKIGRTHLADATPMTLGQEIGGLARQLELAAIRADAAILPILELPIGGTAVGTGINTHRKFGSIVAEYLAAKTKIPFIEAENHFEANSQRDGLVASHGHLKSVAVTLMNVANHIRWLGSGPRCGFYELSIPDLQPGSSIMPGKVNPVMCESLMQVAAKVIGNDTTISVCGACGGQFQLNIMMPVMADVALESIRIMTKGITLFTQKCLEGLEANEEICLDSVEKSLSIVTGLNPVIGYEKAAALAKEAFKTGETIRELCIREEILPSEELEQALDPMRMTKPID